MRILVTGGAGFIGSNLVRALVRAGHEVIVVDNLVTTRSLQLIRDVAPRIRFIHGDIADPAAFDSIPAHPVDVVYHLAASFANELSVEDPALDFRTNVEGTRNTLEWARRAGCGLFVYTGSSSSYGAIAPPFSEDGPLAPDTPYARSKQLAEEDVRRAGLRWAIFRLFNVYGPGDPPGRYRNAIPNMMKALDGEAGRIRVTGAGATRDFCYVDDVVRVLVEAGRGANQIINVGTGRETPVIELARMILDLFGLGPERLILAPPRAWDRVVRRAADVRRLRALFGHVPPTTVAEGLLPTARWLRDAGHVQRGLSCEYRIASSS